MEGRGSARRACALAVAVLLAHAGAASAQQQPNQVTGLTATQRDGFAQLAWTAVEGATDYQIERTPVDAADQFCEDAESDERTAVANEWTLLMNLLQGRPLPEINQALTGKLGGAVRLNEEEIQQVSQIFARCLAVKPRKVANH